MLNVGRLNEGVVLDHIEAGKSMSIYKYLKLDKMDCCVAIIKNAHSNKMGKKDIIKVECPIDELDLNVSSKENYEEFADADNHVRLSLFPKLYIAQQPESLNLVEKQDALFVVSADGGQQPYRYQWQKLNAEGRWVDLPGANQNSYQLAKVTLAQSGLTLRCVVTDEAGDSVTSDSAVLSVFSLPQTGDETQPALWMLLAVASAALIALLCFRRRKDD